MPVADWITGHPIPGSQEPVDGFHPAFLPAAFLPARLPDFGFPAIDLL